MMTRAYIDRRLRTIWEQQERADRARTHNAREFAAAIDLRNDACQSIRFAFSAMRRQIEELEAQKQEVTR